MNINAKLSGKVKGDIRDKCTQLTLTAVCPEEMYILATIGRQLLEMSEGRMRLDLPIQWETEGIPKDLIRGECLTGGSSDVHV